MSQYAAFREHRPPRDSTLKYDLAGEDAEGNQDSTLSVFTRDASGTLRHFYTGHPWLAEDINQRGIDRLTPVWKMLDLTPQGRGDWFPDLSYQRSNGLQVFAGKE